MLILSSVINQSLACLDRESDVWFLCFPLQKIHYNIIKTNKQTTKSLKTSLSQTNVKWNLRFKLWFSEHSVLGRHHVVWPMSGRTCCHILQHLLHLQRRQQISSIYWHKSTKQYGITIQKTIIFTINCKCHDRKWIVQVMKTEWLIQLLSLGNPWYCATDTNHLVSLLQ
jgi:hypothetical protein